MLSLRVLCLPLLAWRYARSGVLSHSLNDNWLGMLEIRFRLPHFRGPQFIISS